MFCAGCGSYVSTQKTPSPTVQERFQGSFGRDFPANGVLCSRCTAGVYKRKNCHISVRRFGGIVSDLVEIHDRVQINFIIRIYFFLTHRGVISGLLKF